jgi:hypothetical protein
VRQQRSYERRKSVAEYPNRDLIEERYGEISLSSDPVDPENPSFSSLLGALKAVHTGEMRMEVLQKYHTVLSVQLDESRRAIEDLEIPVELEEAARDQMNMARGALDIVRVALDMVKKYIGAPSNEAMADCLEALFSAQRVIASLNVVLDRNIQAAQ